ncbi:MAG: M14 family metallopeptidase [Myxococcota bacterium]
MALAWLGLESRSALAREFETVGSELSAQLASAGESVQGRAIPRLDFGTPGKPVVLLSALMHGIELIGSVALLDVLKRLASSRDPLAERLRAAAHFVVLPIVNPDAAAVNLRRTARGFRAWQRCNARGVDLNRNFPRLTQRPLLHPFSGSRFRFSPHYLGQHALSEPETRAVHDVALELRPALSLAFHSFGNLLLYPWAYTNHQNPRVREYLELGRAFARALPHTPYVVKQARQFYSVLGDMDDWLDAECGTLAFTIEVSKPMFSFAALSRLANPFCWMNPERANEVVENLTPAVLALLAAKLGVAS